MQSSLLPRVRAQPFAKCRSLTSSFVRPSRAMGSYATFKVPRIDNEPNVSSSTFVRARNWF
jgi:1-pyrroline-5-carboxylate dehydrogenase